MYASPEDVERNSLGPGTGSAERHIGVAGTPGGSMSRKAARATELPLVTVGVLKATTTPEGTVILDVSIRLSTVEA
jgi:hypothetical protein